MTVLTATPDAALDIGVGAASNVGKLLNKATLSNPPLHEAMNKTQQLNMNLATPSLCVGVPERRKGRL